MAFDPFSAIFGATSGIIQGIAGSGGETQTVGLELPPEFEIELIEASEQNLASITADFEKLQKAEDAFSRRIEAIEGIINATIPPEQALNQLRDSSLSIAESLGQSAEDLIANGFLEADDIDDLKQLEQLESADFSDPRLENQLADERARLEQDLRRQGASPAVRAQALSEFDRRAEESRFGRTEELREGRFGRISSRIGTRAGLRQSGLQQAISSFGVTSEAINQARSGAESLGQLAAGELSVAQTGAAVRGQLRDQRLGTFQSLGEFDFSKRIKQLLGTGEIGPGQVPQANLASGTGRAVAGVNDNNIQLLSNQDLLARINSIQTTQQPGRSASTGNVQDLQFLLNELRRREGINK